ncbi:hypothetical protein CaCOL14_009661 [Colletotrichum acutatum]
MAIDSAEGLPEEWIDKVNAKHQELSKSRKKRPVPEGWATSEEVALLTTVASTSTPVSNASSLATEGSYAAISGRSGDAAIYSIEADQVERQVAVNEPVVDSVWTGSKLIFATSKGSVKVFESGSEVASISEHAGPATSLSLHPTGDLLASVGSDKSIVLYDLNTLKKISRAYADSGKLPKPPSTPITPTNLRSPHILCFPPRWTPLRSRIRYRRNQALHDNDVGGCGCIRTRRACRGADLLRKRLLACSDSQGPELSNNLRFAQGGRCCKGQDTRDRGASAVTCLGLHWTVPGNRGCRRHYCPTVHQELQEMVRAPQNVGGCIVGPVGCWGQAVGFRQRGGRCFSVWTQAGISRHACLAICIISNEDRRVHLK